MLIRIRHEEQGIAMIMSLMVAFVVLLLATVVFGQAVHNSNQGAYSRNRVTSVGAAEAGLNYWYNCIEQTSATSLSTCEKLTAITVGSSPATASYLATPKYYTDTQGTVQLSGAITQSNFPLSVKIKSIGTVNSVSRTMESFIQLSPVYGGFGGAIITNSATTFGNNFQVNGNSGNNGDVYVLNGNLTISNTPVIYGSVYVPNGTLTMSNNNSIKGNAWAYGNMTLTTVNGWAKSTTGSISGGNVGGDATAAGTITSTVAGTKYPGTNPGPVPTQTFPQITSGTAAWTSSGYTLCDTSCYASMSGADNCAKAYNWIHSTTAGWLTSGYTDVVIRIPTVCNFNNGNNDTNTIRGNLAVINDGSFTFSQQSNWNGVSSPIKNVYFISPYTGSACAGTTKDITVGNNTNFDAYTKVFFYTPCTASMNNTNNYAGQVIGGTVSIGNQYTETYSPIVVPGANLTSYTQNIAYIREVA